MPNYDFIKANINAILNELPEGVTLLAATKTVPAELINFAAECGVRVIGENRVNELLSKYDAIDKMKLEIHFIGHLQTNKVKYIIDKVSLIHSVDRMGLAEEISRRAIAKNIVMPVLVEVNIGNEETKSGVAPSEALNFVSEISTLKGIKVSGLMAIPPKYMPGDYTAKKNIAFFEEMRKIFVDIRGKNVDNISMEILSLGMASDWREAAANGSTLIRVGEGVFGERSL